MVEIRKHVTGKLWREIHMYPPENSPLHRGFWKYQEAENDGIQYPTLLYEDYISAEDVGNILRNALKALKRYEAPMIIIVKDRIIAKNF